MGTSLTSLNYCCPNKEFLSASDIDYGLVKTTVEYSKGSTLKLFCDYGNLSALKKLKETYPSIANEKYLFYKAEISRMLSFLQASDQAIVKNLMVYKINFSGTVGYDAHSINNEKISTEFYLNGICKRNNKMEEMIYSYQWRKIDGIFPTTEPKQKVEFKPINNDDFKLIGGKIVV